MNLVYCLATAAMLLFELIECQREPGLGEKTLVDLINAKRKLAKLYHVLKWDSSFQSEAQIWADWLCSEVNKSTSQLDFSQIPENVSPIFDYAKFINNKK